jgi:hypothetical protein
VARRREWLAGGVLAVAGLVVSLAVFEVGVRMLHLVPDRFWEPDPLLGVRLIPGSTGWWTQEDREFVVPVRINSHGHRDSERSYDKAAGTFRILVLGDSFVEALQVPIEATFTHVLEAELGADGAHPPIEVVSAGVSGHGTASELLFFESEGRRYAPDLVILAFYPGNDVKNNSPSLEDRFAPVYAPDGSLMRVQGQQRGERRGWTSLLPRSEAYVYARQLLLQRQPAIAAKLMGLGLVQPEAIRRAAERDGIPVDYGVYAVPLSQEWEDAWQRTERLLERLRVAVTNGGAAFAIMIVSTRDQIYPDLWAQVRAATPAMQGRDFDLEAPQRRLLGWCTAQGVPCLALTPAFRDAAGAGGEYLHYPHEGHWTAAGHRLAASHLNDFLRTQRLLPTAQGGMKHEGH